MVLLLGAPIAHVLPSLDNATELPNLSPELVPVRFAPPVRGTHALPEYVYTWTYPLALVVGAPIAHVLPSLDKDTEVPNLSSEAVPVRFVPNCDQVVPEYVYTWTSPLVLLGAPIAHVLPSVDNATAEPFKCVDVVVPLRSVPNCDHADEVLE